MGRLLSGPVVAHMILQHQWPAAMITLAIAGISDWADGYAAKHWGQSSVLGSYLDPLADKVLVCCTVGALAAEVRPPPALSLCFKPSLLQTLMPSLNLCSGMSLLQNFASRPLCISDLEPMTGQTLPRWSRFICRQTKEAYMRQNYSISR